MDQGPKVKRKTNPGENATFLTRITFLFAVPICLLSRRPSFNENDVYETMPSFSSEALVNNLETEWDIEKYKKKPSFFRSLCRVFGVTYAIWGLSLIVIDIAVMVIMPSLVGRIVASFDTAHNQDVIIDIVLLIGTMFLRVVLANVSNFALKNLLLRVKIASSTLIYQKSLRLNTGVTTNPIIGQAVTMLSNDLTIFDAGAAIVHEMFAGIIKITVMTCMIFNQIGVSAFIGVAVLLTFIFIQALLASKIMHYKLVSVKRMDERTQLIQEILSAIRIIKMYVWESFVCKLIHNARRKEVRSLQLIALLRSFSMTFGLFSRSLSLFICITTFVAFGNVLTAETAYTVAGCFATLGVVLNIIIPRGFAVIAEILVMIRRINSYLLIDEVKINKPSRLDDTQGVGIVLKNVTINQGNLMILKDVSLSITPGITLITGDIGCGKSTLLKAILGDVRAMGDIGVFGIVSYASQEPWLFPGTIKQNIVFTEIFNISRYQKVIRVCALEKDINSFIKGDETLLSDKGLNLSQGQKVRINLARAIYKVADIYILDDCLSSVDAEVGRHVFHECIMHFLGSKVRVLVSHLYPFLSKVDEVVLLHRGLAECHGGIKSDDTATEFSNKIVVSSEARIKPTDCCNAHEDVEESSALLPNSDGLTENPYQETAERGKVKKEVYFNYLLAAGIKIFFALVIVLFIKQAVETWSNLCLRYWVDAEQNMVETKIQYGANSTEFDQAKRLRNIVLNQYSTGVLTSVLIVVAKALVTYLFVERASIKIHKAVIEKIVNAPMMFFNSHHAGNILNRFSRDFHIIDVPMSSTIVESIEVSIMIGSVLVVVSSASAWLLIPSACVVLVFCIAIVLYIPSGRNIRRVEGSVRSPVIGYLETTFDGLTTIRALGAQKVLQKEFYNHIDVYSTVQYMYLSAQEAFRFLVEILAACYTSIVVIALTLLKNSMGGATAGLAITQSMALTDLLKWGAFQWPQLEMHMTSAERIFEYTRTESEDKSGSSFTDKSCSSRIVYENVNMRYSQNSNTILRDLSFTIERGEKVGIVGRTGTGKSSVISALIRLYPFEGTITVDDVDINNVKIDDLRSRISIIPQNPMLLSGTIRSNLDPNSEHSDKELWNALEHVEMKSKIGRLDLVISEFTTPFSTGEKQLICLARVILHNNPIIVLDEITAHVDSHTEYLIQGIIRRIFTRSTIIIIAHRLHTLMDCDKILVIDSGGVVESDHPKSLLNKREGVFYSMVKQAGLPEYKDIFPQ